MSEHKRAKRGGGRISVRVRAFRLFGFAFLTLVSAHAATYEPAKITPPKPVREFRGAWVSTVANGDWPSRKDLTTAEQKAELIAIFDRAVQLKLNAIILQVRPSCDALYASPIEPWSEFLTGAMGKAPEPFYDPLSFAVEEAHKRGLELHAWFNPYRALHPAGKSPVASNHVSKTRPQIVRAFGKYLWLDPGEKETQDYSFSVVMDVVKRYDVDGVHFDDYFYPYASYLGKAPDRKPADFPDDASWNKAGANGKLSRGDWRRENVNAFVERVYRGIKATKPWVKFGIAPFGIWKPGVPASIDSQAMNAYDELYCDSRKWLANGWVDYLAPQLYWPIEPPKHSFRTLLEWWDAQDAKQRHIWPGLDVTKLHEGRSAGEITNQIRIAARQPVSAGHIHWNMKSLTRSSELQTALTHGAYADAALVPACKWLGSVPPSQPRVTASTEKGEALKLSIQSTNAEPASLWLVQIRRSGHWTTQIAAGTRRALTLDGDADVIAVSAIDHVGNASAPVVLKKRGT